ncbi:flagella synthesis protein FlgN [Massilia norwichensis]|uniref:Flagellar protein FlgN n=1 Tax=Massilia norwichensis TaxID=1442366 RepID=A0ABT2A5H9_9BURK|nr:flagellar protein FlgN [Massilia norwichensis]MCS0589443.1 flagellar protein FlgN [Massilia norwichensis]
MVTASPGATLREEQQLIGSIVELMKSEQQFLVSADADGLSTITPKKLQLAQKATELSRLRHRALGAAGFPSLESSMEPWLAVEGNDELRADWNRLLELTREARELNRVNGMLVNKQLAHTQNMLNELRPATDGAGVYGPGGQALASGPSRRYVVG